MHFFCTYGDDMKETNIIKNNVRYVDIDENKNLIGERIKYQSKKHKITIKELAYLLNDRNERTIKAYRKGETIPPLSILLTMCNLFECDLEYLLGFQECETKEKTDIHNATGLTDTAIEAITGRPEYDDYILSKKNNKPFTDDTFSWCITHGMLNIIYDLYLIRKCNNLCRNKNTPKELSQIVNSCFSDASSDIFSQMDLDRFFLNNLVLALSEYDDKTLTRLNKQIDSLQVKESGLKFGFYAVVDEDIKQFIIECINDHDIDDEQIDKNRKNTIYQIAIKAYKNYFPELQFEHSLESSKFAISKKFNNMVDDYVEQYVNGKENK